MTSRERVLTSLAHRQPDRMAVDFGGTCVTTMNVENIEALRAHYGLEPRPVKVIDVFTMAGVIDDDLAEAIGSDCAPALPSGTMFGFPKNAWKEWRDPFGQVILVPESFNPQPDGHGGYLVHPQGDLTVPPSGRMPAGCVYFEAIVRQEELDEDRLNPEDNVEEWKLLGEQDLLYLKHEIDRAYDSGRAVVLAMPGMGLGDASDIPGCGLRHPKGVRDYTEWYMSPLLRPDYVRAVFEKQTELAIRNMEAVLEIAEDKIDVVFTCAADLAHQESLFVSPEVFRELYAPYYRRANDWIHANTRWKILKHCCGAVEPLIPQLIEVGFDALNPVQCSARGMEPRHLKEAYGRDITFWGGGVDTQQVLPFGTPEEVRAQVLERCEIFARDGGFLFNSIHNIQHGTPIQNIVAMIEAVREFNGS